MIYQDRLETSCLSFVSLFFKSTLLLNYSKHNWQALGEEFTERGPILNYVQHIFPGRSKKLFRGI